MSAVQATVPLDELVNTTVETHQMVSPIRPTNSSPNAILGNVNSVDVIARETISSPQQVAQTSPPIKTILLDALMPTTTAVPQMRLE